MNRIIYFFFLVSCTTNLAFSQIQWDFEVKAGYGLSKSSSNISSSLGVRVIDRLDDNSIVIEKGTRRNTFISEFYDYNTQNLTLRAKKAFNKAFTFYSGLGLTILNGKLKSEIISSKFTSNGMIDTLAAISNPTQGSTCLLVNSQEDLNLMDHDKYQIYDLIIPIGLELHFNSNLSIYGAFEFATPIYTSIKSEFATIEEIGISNGQRECKFVKNISEDSTGNGFRNLRANLSYGAAYNFNDKLSATLGIHQKSWMKNENSSSQLSAYSIEAGVRFNLSRSWKKDKEETNDIFQK